MLREARFISPFALGCNETRSEWPECLAIPIAPELLRLLDR